MPDALDALGERVDGFGGAVADAAEVTRAHRIRCQVCSETVIVPGRYSASVAIIRHYAESGHLA